jgi:drug/metabolite transporter (DMT)-like permease
MTHFAPQIVPTTFSLAAVFAWGTSDFLGGYAARRANAFLLTSIAHASGLVMMLALAEATHAQFPSERSMLWALAGGMSGGGALAIFYRVLARGKMGLMAPVAAVMGAAIPTIFAMTTQGMPGAIQVAGFVVAALGIWLISGSGEGGEAAGVGTAALAGIGFAGFYLGMSRATDGSALWLATFSRIGAVAVTGSIVILQRRFTEITVSGVRWGLLAGCLDVSGTALFVRASQTGRLDSAVVLTSLYPAVTVLLARLVLHEHFTRWKAIGMFAALLAVPMIAGQ